MPRRAGAAVVAVSVSLLASCVGPDDSNSASSADTTAGTHGLGRLVEPAEFEESVAAASVIVINVHVPYDGHIEGTDAFVPFDTIGTWSDLPADLNASIALYCRSGNMSATATRTLTDMGYTNVVDLAGGMNAWKASGRQLEES